jgi:hypothetical protein
VTITQSDINRIIQSNLTELLFPEIKPDLDVKDRLYLERKARGFPLTLLSKLSGIRVRDLRLVEKYGITAETIAKLDRLYDDPLFRTEKSLKIYTITHPEHVSINTDTSARKDMGVGAGTDVRTKTIKRKKTMTTNEKLIDLLWKSMTPVPDHKGHVQTNWGTKSKKGICATIRRIIAEDIYDGNLARKSLTTEHNTKQKTAVGSTTTKVSKEKKKS